MRIAVVADPSRLQAARPERRHSVATFDLVALHDCDGAVVEGVASVELGIQAAAQETRGEFLFRREAKADASASVVVAVAVAVGIKAEIGAIRYGIEALALASTDFKNIAPGPGRA